VFLSESGSPRSDRFLPSVLQRGRSHAATAITFQRGLNLTIAMVHAEHSDKVPGQLTNNPVLRWNKKALLQRRHSGEPSQLRHCREATKLRPRCLMRVATTPTGNYS